MNYPRTITDDAITVIIDGKPMTVPKGSIQFEQVKQAIRVNAPDFEIKALFNASEAVNRFTEGEFALSGNDISYKDEPVPQCIAERILYLMRERLPYSYLKNFWMRLHNNESRRAQQELFKFMEHKGMCITPEGMVRAYKAITNAWLDKYSRTFSNRLGADLNMPRRAVCDDADLGCSYGYHCGSLEYVRGFAYGYGQDDGDRIVIVEFDPKDVVSVPKDCGCQKVRVCHYRVIEEFTGELPSFGSEQPAGEEEEFWSVDEDENGNEILTITTDEFEAAKEEAVDAARDAANSGIAVMLARAREQGRTDANEEIARRLQNVAGSLA